MADFSCATKDNLKGPRDAEQWKGSSGYCTIKGTQSFSPSAYDSFIFKRVNDSRLWLPAQPLPKGKHLGSAFFPGLLQQRVLGSLRCHCHDQHWRTNTYRPAGGADGWKEWHIVAGKATTVV